MSWNMFDKFLINEHYLHIKSDMIYAWISRDTV